MEAGADATDTFEDVFVRLKLNDCAERVGDGGRDAGGVGAGVFNSENAGVPGCLFVDESMILK